MLRRARLALAVTLSLGLLSACAPEGTVAQFAGLLLGPTVAGRLDNDIDRARAERCTRELLNSATAGPGERRSWTSEVTPNVGGSSTLLRVAANQAGQQCKLVREIAIIRGQEVQQESNYCRGNTGAWALQA